MPLAKSTGSSTQDAIRDALLNAAIDEATESESGERALLETLTGQDGTITTWSQSAKDVDKVTVYNQNDGVSSSVLVSMLRKQLSKRFPRDSSIPEGLWGKLAFKMTKPAGLGEKATYMCLMHKDNPERVALDVVGLGGRFCTKANIPSAMDAEMHMQRKHPQEHKLIKDTLQRNRDQEDRDLRRQEVEAMQALAKSGIRS